MAKKVAQFDSAPFVEGPIQVRFGIRMAPDGEILYARIVRDDVEIGLTKEQALSLANEFQRRWPTHG